MELQLLAVEACPHVSEFEERLAVALAGLEGAAIRRRVIADDAEAAAAGMHGSPTRWSTASTRSPRPASRPACRAGSQELCRPRRTCGGY